MRLCLVVLLVWFTAACSGPKADEHAIKALVRDFVQAFGQNDWYQVASFIDPAELRALGSAEAPSLRSPANRRESHTGSDPGVREESSAASPTEGIEYATGTEVFVSSMRAALETNPQFSENFRRSRIKFHKIDIRGGRLGVVRYQLMGSLALIDEAILVTKTDGQWYMSLRRAPSVMVRSGGGYFEVTAH